MGSNIPGGACTTHLTYRGFEVELRLYQSVPASARVTCEIVRNLQRARGRNRYKRSAAALITRLSRGPASTRAATTREHQSPAPAQPRAPRVPRSVRQW